MNILLKLYPQITDKIITIGFLQALEKFDGFEAPQSLQEGATETLKHHYIMTDTEGVIVAVTEGMFHEMGLITRFF